MPFSGPLEDRILIQELNAEYSDAVSRREAAAFGATWAEDAGWLLPWLGEAKGRDTIVVVWLEQIANYPFYNFAAQVGALAVDGDRAAGRVWSTERVMNRAGVSGTVIGRYDDLYIKHDGRWLFARRAFEPLHGMEALVMDG